MKIRTKSAVIYRIIDFVNSQEWYTVGITATLCAISIIWTLGYLTFVISL